MGTQGQDHEPMEPIVINRTGRTPLLLTCEHATRYIPPHLDGLGLSNQLLNDHVAWDIGALRLAKELAQQLDAPLIAAPASRVLIDPNRDLDAPNLIPLTAEGVIVPGNQYISARERSARIAAYHTPYHQRISEILSERTDIRGLVSMHSFTPTLFGRARPWHVGVLFRKEERLVKVILQHLDAMDSIVIGRNEPYAPSQGVYYAMDRHAGARQSVMIEIRNDLLVDKIRHQLIRRSIVRILITAIIDFLNVDN